MSRFSLGCCALVALVLVGCADLQRPTYPTPDETVSGRAPSEEWSLFTSTDALGRPYSWAVTEGGGIGEILYLSLHCRSGIFDVAVDDNSWETSVSTEVRYSIDLAPEVTVAWLSSGELNLYRGGSPVTFAESLAASSTLGITVSKQLRTGFIERRAQFKLDGLAPHLSALRSQCSV
jgi:hypothetical protein